MATREQIEAKLRQLIGRLDAADERVRQNLVKAVPSPRVVQMDVPDLDASYWTELASGELGELHTGAAAKPDIRITADSEDLVAMIDGTKNLFSSYLAGRIRVQASVSDMLALRRLL